MTDYSVKLHILSEIVPVKHIPTKFVNDEFDVEDIVNFTDVSLFKVPCTPNAPMYVPFTFIRTLVGIELVMLLFKQSVPTQSNG